MPKRSRVSTRRSRSFRLTSRPATIAACCFWSSIVPSKRLPASTRYCGSTRRTLARINRGNALAELGRLEEAIAEYDRALAMFPNHPGALFNRGNALHGMGRYDEAIAAFDRALAIVPRHAEAWNNRATALYALNRHAQALESCARAIAVRKDYADAHHNEALSLLAMGDFAP